MALTQELESDIRRAINPIYASRIGTESHERSALLGEIDRLRGEVDAKQAEVDRLMLEYCPDEMTEEQMENWKRAQTAKETTK